MNPEESYYRLSLSNADFLIRECSIEKNVVILDIKHTNNHYNSVYFKYEYNGWKLANNLTRANPTTTAQPVYYNFVSIATTAMLHIIAELLNLLICDYGLSKTNILLPKAEETGDFLHRGLQLNSANVQNTGHTFEYNSVREWCHNTAIGFDVEYCDCRELFLGTFASQQSIHLRQTTDTNNVQTIDWWTYLVDGESYIDPKANFYEIKKGLMDLVQPAILNGRVYEYEDLYKWVLETGLDPSLKEPIKVEDIKKVSLDEILKRLRLVDSSNLY